MTDLDAQRAYLVTFSAHAEPDAVRVLTYIAERLAIGRIQYGDLNLATDKRDWSEEERAEHADAAVYRACAEIVRLAK